MTKMNHITFAYKRNEKVKSAINEKPMAFVNEDYYLGMDEDVRL